MEYRFKYIFIGNVGCGKTSICEKYCKNTFSDDMSSTIGIEFFLKRKKMHNGDMAIMQMWDTAGHERFRSITRGYYHGSHCVVYVFDLTDRTSFDDLDNWIALSKDAIDDDVIRILVGNKKDMIDKRQIDNDEANAFATKNGMLYIEASPKTGECINDIFNNTAEKLYNDVKSGKISMNRNTVNLRGPPVYNNSYNNCANC